MSVAKCVLCGDYRESSLHLSSLVIFPSQFGMLLQNGYIGWVWVGWYLRISHNFFISFVLLVTRPTASSGWLNLSRIWLSESFGRSRTNISLLTRQLMVFEY